MGTKTCADAAAENAIRPNLLGRERELRRLRSLLRSARLVTVTGPGAVGKTALARALTSDRATCLVDVAAVRDHVRDAVAAALGIEDDDRLADTIGDRRLLLVLDGCEHIVDQCGRLAESLLRRCPGVRILATSRESLRVPGEVTFRIGGLEVPEPAEKRRRVLQRSDAVRLFLARLPASDRKDVSLGTVAEVCRRLDGLPLAVELAAHQARRKSLTQILAELDDGPKWRLDGHGPARHRDLTAVLDWSHRLLSPPERAVFRRLSVLVGGFDVEAATAVCADGNVGAAQVLPLLLALEAKSLIAPGTGDGKRARFAQLNCVRGYAFERLREAGEVDATRDRAAAWLSGRAEALCETLFFGNTELQRLQHERDNLAAAIHYTSDDDCDRRVLLGVALARVRWQQRHSTTARRLLTTVLRPSLKSRYHSEALTWSALAASAQADHAQAVRLAEHAVRAARKQNPPALAKALDALAFVRAGRGDLSGAVPAHRECLEVVRPLRQPLDIAKCQNCLAWTLVMVGDTAEAEQLLDQALPVYRALAAPVEQAAALNTVGALQLSKQDFAAAEAAFLDVLHTVPPDDYVGSLAVDGLAIVAAGRGDPGRAVTLTAAARAARERSDLEPAPAWQHWVDAASRQARSRLSRSKVDSASALGRQLAGDHLEAYLFERAPLAAEGPLSHREAQIAGLVADGLTNQEIADRLHLSARTVRSHLTNIHCKLDLRSRTQVAVWAVLRSGRSEPLGV
ncbi:MAG TPA: LuxR C-terminal-related transcriptional regulator [Amycolatopsis sp.]|nr:LuxR C-terminal-related transcriptional regulator [Amycolatopsis sp.]